MQVIRTMSIETEDFQIGDRLPITLSGFGSFTATVHQVTDEGALFIFDEYVASRPMNEDNTNRGGFEKSDLREWMNTKLLSAFPEDLKNRIKELTIPSIGQMFGHEDEWDNEHFETDNDEQLPLMKERRYRVAYLDNRWEWGWLRNAMKKKHSAACFADVNGGGGTTCYGAAYSGGVRPAFWLVK